MTRSFLLSLFSCLVLALMGALAPMAQASIDEEEERELAVKVARVVQGTRHPRELMRVRPTGCGAQVSVRYRTATVARRVPRTWRKAARHWRRALLPRDDGGAARH